ncbi:MAG: gephyrin-like molybdotransferase Glp [Pseudomonadota bacterium]
MKNSVPPELCDVDPLQIHAETALQKIRQSVEPIVQVESVAIRDCLGRVLASPVTSAVDVPNHTNSAMDGYAFKGAGGDQVGKPMMRVVGESLAGAPYRGSVGGNECVRIMTGAVMPVGTDTVVPQEQTERDGDRVSINAALRVGENVRYAGEDMKAGDTVIRAGTRLGSAHIGVAASLGLTELSVFRKPRVAFFSNGDELRSIGESLEEGDVYDSNRYTLYSMLKEADADIIDLGIVRDDPAAIGEALVRASDCADMIITSAGASVGDADYVRQLLGELGDVSFWKVAIKPGRPLSFGKIRNRLFFGLPGNPVSVMVTFQLFVKSALKILSGESDSFQLKLSVRCMSTLRKRPGRAEYQRGILSVDENGETVVHSTGQQGSGILSSMAVANCYIMLDTDAQGAEPGDMVFVQPFKEIL